MKLAFLLVACLLFAAPSFDRGTVPGGDGPVSVAIADVNHDGRSDIVAVNMNSRTLTVLLGDGRGHFHAAPGPPCANGQSPNDLAFGDFNGDGNIDIAIANTEVPLITILLGDGKGGFRPSEHSPFTVDSHPHIHGLAVADFRGEGKLDVVTDDWVRNQVRLLVGDGAGNLIGPVKPFATGRLPYCACARLTSRWQARSGGPALENEQFVRLPRWTPSLDAMRSRSTASSKQKGLRGAKRSLPVVDQDGQAASGRGCRGCSSLPQR